MKKIFSCFLIIAAVFFLFGNIPQLFSQITITKNSLTQNPTLYFQGIRGNKELSQKILSDLHYCGWFDLTNNKNADYIISGSASGNNVTLKIANSAGLTITTVNGSGSDIRESAHKAVDAVLKQLFQVSGICNTKIVLVVTTKQGKREIVTCDFDGSNIQQITQNKTHSIEPLWAPDGKSIVYTYYGTSYTCLVQYNLAMKQSRKLTGYSGLNAGGAMTPNGKYTALVLGKGNQIDLYVRETEGSKLQQITKNSSVEASPCWSPDGKTLCFVSDVTGRPTLHTVIPGSGDPKQIRSITGSERVTPDWSSDNKIAYSAKVGSSYRLAVIDMASGSPVQVPVGNNANIPGEGPSWAPDNRHVVLEHNGAVYVVDTFLGKSRKLLSGSSAVSQPDWSPILP